MAKVTSVTSGSPQAQGVRAGEAAYGLCYGIKTSPIPDPIPLVEIYKSHRISKIWLSPAPLSTNNEAVTKILDLFMSDPDLNSKIKISLWIDYEDFNSVADDETNAKKWVDAYVNDRYKTVIGHVCVGDVIGPCDNFSISIFESGMSNLRNYLSNDIKLSTIVNESFLFAEPHSGRTPPSKCVLTEKARALLKCLSSKNVPPFPLFFAIMPYFMIGRDGLPVDNCILEPAASTYLPDKNYSYNHAFDVMVDSIYCAGDMGQVDIIAVSGWPTKGKDPSASDVNAKQYIPNLINHIGKLTPRNNKPVDIFIYSLVDENQLDTSVDEFKHLGAKAYLPPVP